jgi:hypothetical protein
MARPSHAVKENHKTSRDVGLAESGIALLFLGVLHHPLKEGHQSDLIGVGRVRDEIFLFDAVLDLVLLQNP